MSDAPNTPPNNHKGAQGVQRMFVAARYNQLDAMERLIAEGADVNMCLDGVSPLHVAARYGQADVVDLLITNGADVNKTTKKGYTPLLLIMSAAKHPLLASLELQQLHVQQHHQGYAGVVRLLLKEMKKENEKGEDRV